MTLPLLAGYTITGDALPERYQPPKSAAPAFRLPGTDALSAFADLLGDAPDTAPAPQEETAGAPFPLPALLPEDVTGCVFLRREVDFGDCTGDWAQIAFDMLCGEGEVTLESLPPRYPRPGTPPPEPITLHAAFRDGPLTLDVTQALLSRRRFALTVQFSGRRPAGVCGAICLRTAAHAGLIRLMAEPSAAPGTVTVHARIAVQQSGNYLLHAQACPALAQGEALPVYERPLQLTAGETRTIRLNLNLTAAPFAPGKAYASSAIKLWLYRKIAGRKKAQLCDSLALPFGLPGPAPDCCLPLTADDCRRPPQTLTQQLLALHVAAVSLPAAAPDLLYRSLTRSGIAARQASALPDGEQLRLSSHACVTFAQGFAPGAQESDDPALSAWQLCGLLTCPRIPEPGLTAAQLLREASGRELSPASPAVQEVLLWLRAFSVRLRAEAMRQKRITGAFCHAGEWSLPDVADALQTALAPLHLSALPLCGAWWSGSHFSASLRAFIPEGRFPAGTSMRAEAVLEDAQGGILAKKEWPCPALGGALGLIDAVLPDDACALELITRLIADGEVVEESTQPVYVGVRGALEAAFAACPEEFPC